MTITEAAEQLSNKLRVRHFARSTEKSYLGWLRSYMAVVSGLPPGWSSEQKVEEFLTREARRGVAASTQNQALNALVFFYKEVLGQPLGTFAGVRVQRPGQVRSALSLDATRALLGALEDVGGYPTRLIVRLLYGCGLRVTEPLEIRLKDIDEAGRRLSIRGSKGGKDRAVPLPECLVAEVAAQVRVARAVWRGDQAANIPTALPGLLARKSPRLTRMEAWAWLFPAHAPMAHPRTGERVRWRMHEVNVQRTVRAAAARAGLDGKVTPHTLRHCYATHAHRAGAAARDLQAVLGHAHLDTTVRYLAPDERGVRSPLEAMG